jgi:RNA polymerase sigma-70 factor (ECF subfamily)
MATGSITTVVLHRLVDRMRAGDTAARDELVQGFYARLEELTRRMLRRFPGVKRWEDTGDVLHKALLRLLRALGDVRPDSTRAFLGLAALQIRRELINLAHHYSGPLGLATNQNQPIQQGDSSLGPGDPPALDESNDLEKWSAFHQAVDSLPEEEREIVGLLFYHGLTRDQAAELLDISEKTVQRRWRAAMTRVHPYVKELSE